MQPLYHDEKWLRKQYIDYKFSTRDIAKICNTNCTTILKWMKKLKIPRRKSNDPYFRPPVNKDLRRYKNYDWLYQKYVVEKMSTVKIGRLIGVNYKTVTHWLKRFDIPRSRKGKYIGKNNGRWKGEYFSKVLNRWYRSIDGKKIPRYRDNVEKYLNRKLKRYEHIHHINGDSCDDRIENLYLFSGEKKHQNYHQDFVHYILKNIHQDIIDLTKADFLIRKSNLPNLKE